MLQIKRNSFFGFLGFAIPLVVVFAAYPVLIRHLGKEEFGIFILATSISGVLAFLDLGIAAATIKFIAEDIGRSDTKSAADVLVVSLAFYGVLGILVAMSIWFLAPWLVSMFPLQSSLRGDAAWAFRLAAIQFAAFMLTTVFISLFKGLHRFDRATLALVVLSVATYGGAIAGVLGGGVGVVGVTAISLGANLLVLALSVAMALSLCRASGIVFVALHFPLHTFRRMLGFSSVMAINSISGVLLYQIQRYLIGVLIGPAAVAVYQLATTVPAKAHAAVNSVTEIMFPLTSASKNHAILRQVYLRMLIGSAAIGLTVLLPLAFFAKPLMTLWVGEELADQVAPLVPIFALAYFFLALSPAPYHVVNGVGKPWLNTVSYAFNAVANVVLIGLFALDGITLVKFAWAFALANIVNSLLYQAAVEFLIWRRTLLMASPGSLEGTGEKPGRA